MTLAELLAQHEATRDQLRQQGNPLADNFDVLVQNTKEIIAAFERAASRTRY